MPGISSLPGMVSTKVPACMVTRVDATVSGGELTRLDLPLNQFDTHHRMSGPVQLVAGISAAGPVAAPQQATPLAVSQLLPLFQHMGGDG